MPLLMQARLFESSCSLFCDCPGFEIDADELVCEDTASSKPGVAGTRPPVVPRIVGLEVAEAAGRRVGDEERAETRCGQVPLKQADSDCQSTQAESDYCDACSDETPRLPEQLKLPEWCIEPDLTSAPGLACADSVTKLIAVRIVRHPPLMASSGGWWKSSAPATESLGPWLQEDAAQVYADMGMRDTGKKYLATWLNLNDASVLSIYEVLDESWFETCVAQEDCMTKRMKLITVSLGDMIPAKFKGSDDAETAGQFFGEQNASCTRGKTRAGAEYACMQINVYASFLIRVGLKKVGFKKGNTVKMLLVDWPGKAVPAGWTLNVTDSFLQLLA